MVFDVHIHILVKEHHQNLFISFLCRQMQRTAPQSHEVQVDGGLREDVLDIVGLFEIDGQLNRKPTVACALVNIDFHLKQLIEYISSLAEDSVMKGSPSLFPQFVDDKGLHLLDFNESLLFDILGEILKDIKELSLILLLDFLEHLLALAIQILPNAKRFLFIVVLVLLIVSLFDFRNAFHVGLLHAEDVVEVSLVYVDVLILFLGLNLLKQLHVNLHAFLNAVVSNRPA
jgi:hypothetical protein